jgi:hypothetical protein
MVAELADPCFLFYVYVVSPSPTTGEQKDDRPSKKFFGCSVDLAYHKAVCMGLQV